MYEVYECPQPNMVVVRIPLHQPQALLELPRELLSINGEVTVKILQASPWKSGVESSDVSAVWLQFSGPGIAPGSKSYHWVNYIEEEAVLMTEIPDAIRLKIVELLEAGDEVTEAKILTALRLVPKLRTRKDLNILRKIASGEKS